MKAMRHQANKQPTLGHVLLVRTDRLGDMLLTLPMVDALRSGIPRCRVSVLASPANAEAARHHPDLEQVEVDPHEAKGSGLRGVWALAQRIRALRCDAAVIVHPTPRVALAVWLAGVPIRVGTAYRAYAFLFTHRVREHRRRAQQKHESEYNLNLLRPLGVAPEGARPFSWRVSPQEARQVDEVLAARGLAHARIVAIQPSTAGSSLNWPPSRYAELGRELTGAGIPVIVVGSQREAALVEELVGAIGTGAVNLSGLSLGELGALFQRSALYIGCSTGPTHLAASVGTPVIALYSPLRSAAPARWRPLGKEVRIFQPDVDRVCPTCIREKCPYYQCMDQHLSVATVWRSAKEILGC